LAQLKAVPDSLLAIGKYDDEEGGSVARSFGLSYQQLTEECQFVLRRLGLAPVPCISVEVAAALADMSTRAADTHLRQLRAESLVEEDQSGYQLHDLIRRYAKDLASHENQAENKRAINRVLAYYYTAATYLDSLLTRQPPPVLELPPPDMNHHFADRNSAISWAKAELENFLACADYAASDGGGRDLGHEEAGAWTIRLSTALAGLLRNEGRWLRSIELQTRAIAAATQLSKPLDEANALHERGQLYRLSGALAGAEDDLLKALEIYREIGGEAGEIGEAHVLDTYGVVLDQRKRRAEARNRFDESLARYRRLGDRLGEANALHNRGMLEYFAEDYRAAAALIGQSLQLYQQVDHPLGLAHAHSDLAKAQRRLGLAHEATENLEAAQEFYQQLGNVLGNATTGTELGAALRQEGVYDRAESELCQAAKTLEEIGNKLALANALVELGDLHIGRGHSEQAKSLMLQALELYHRHDIDRDVRRLMEKLRSLGFLDEVDEGGR
jgi:tetratricopeptide (TPR) repeat protein